VSVRGFRRELARGVNQVGGRGFALAPPRRRHFRVFVFVLRVTRRAPRLLDSVTDHRDHRMVGDAALTRTVVIQNVTEPKPALIHENPR
jgi:hypothetical protein